ncbi:MAG: holin [Clostridia bacterium]|nr:holin [Clostridia bacterium]
MKNNFLKWLKAAGIRAIKTVAQTAIAVIGTSAMLDEVNWIAVLSASALSGVLSLLTSIAGLPEVKKLNAEGEEINNGYDGEDGI